jgi:hypothetical protein
MCPKRKKKQKPSLCRFERRLRALENAVALLEAERYEARRPSYIHYHPGIMPMLPLNPDELRVTCNGP